MGYKSKHTWCATVFICATIETNIDVKVVQRHILTTKPVVLSLTKKSSTYIQTFILIELGGKLLLVFVLL